MTIRPALAAVMALAAFAAGIALAQAITQTSRESQFGNSGVKV